MPRWPQKSKAEVKSSGPGVTGACKLCSMDAENQTWVPEGVASSLNGWVTSLFPPGGVSSFYILSLYVSFLLEISSNTDKGHPVQDVTCVLWTHQAQLHCLERVPNVYINYNLLL